MSFFACSTSLLVDCSQAIFLTANVIISGLILRAGYVDGEGFIHADSNGVITGKYAELHTDIADKINATIEFVESYDGNYGSMAEDGSWNGMIKVRTVLISYSKK